MSEDISQTPARTSRRVINLLKKNAVLACALVAALISCFFVPPDAVYAGYFDLKTLACLFSVLAVVCALRNVQFFQALAHAIVSRFRTARRCAIALVAVTFVGSMLIANDMALLTFLPLGWLVLGEACGGRYTALLFILQNIAANLGGMLTPFGNPQNLFLYTKFHIPTGEFMHIMLPSFALSALMIFACCFFIKDEPIEPDKAEYSLPKLRTGLYLALFAVAICMVFRLFPYWCGLAAVAVTLAIADRRALAKVDYGLLMTFAAFFVFAGNMARIDAVRTLLGGLLAKNTLVTGTLSCQVISNVPSAVLLSQFTGNYRSLLVAVNIGGTGTPVASLASLITLRAYIAFRPARAKKYIALFLLINFAFLAVLLAFESMIGG